MIILQYSQIEFKNNIKKMSFKIKKTKKETKHKEAEEYDIMREVSKKRTKPQF